MTQAATCPGCGTINRPDAGHCQMCGKALHRCPECNSLNADTVEFCAKCGKMLTRIGTPAMTETNSTKKHYVVWEGFPFAWLARVSQTKTEYFLRLGIGVGIGAVGIAIFLAYAIPAAMRGEPGASSSVCLLTTIIILFAAIAFWAWVLGRRGAEDEEKRRREV